MPKKAPLNQDLLATYSAVYRLASRPYGLSKATGGAGRFQFATIYHAATALRDAHVRRVQVAIETSGAAIIWADFVKLTSAVTPATGNPAITPSPIGNQPGSAAEATCLALPTTGGTEGALIETVEWNLGAVGAAPTTNPPPPLVYVDLYNHLNDPETLLPAMRAGKAEGFAVVLDVNAAVTVVAHVIITFSEQ